MASRKDTVEISVRVNALGNLFHALDPSPFSEKRLTEQAETFIVDRARTASHSAPLKVTIIAPSDEVKSQNAQETSRAISKFFEYRVEQARHDLRNLFQEGRRAALIGAPILVVCILLSQYLSSQVNEPAVVNLLGQSLLILGWVANWRPLEIFLYAWWPIRRRKELFARLAQAQVHVRPA